jgi:hypothetical protein
MSEPRIEGYQIRILSFDLFLKELAEDDLGVRLALGSACQESL